MLTFSIFENSDFSDFFLKILIFENFENFEILKINFLQDEKIFFIRIFFIVLVYSSAIPNIHLEHPRCFQDDAIQRNHIVFPNISQFQSRILQILKIQVLLFFTRFECGIFCAVNFQRLVLRAQMELDKNI